MTIQAKFQSPREDLSAYLRREAACAWADGAANIRRVGLLSAAAITAHTIPESVSIAIPVYDATGSKPKAVLATSISVLAEPLGAVLGYLVLTPFLSPTVYGWVFGVIAGVMVFLALDELMPEAKRYSKGHEAAYGMVMAVLALSLVLLK